MPSYRFDIANTGRATCKSAECKTAQVKIQKGELRFGSFVSTDKFESWSWKHWGCVTPAQIDNVVKSIGGLEAFEEDPNVLDGYEEVDEGNQEKIRTALKEGHVPDEDWKGDPENNRPGARGMKAKRTPKKKKQEDGEEGEEEEGEAEASPSKPKPKKGKKAKTTESKDEASDASPAAKKKSSGKRKTSAEDDGAAPEMPAKKARGRKPKRQAHNEEDSEPEVMPAKKQRGKKPQPADDAEDNATAEAKPAIKPRTKKAANDEEQEPLHPSSTTADKGDAKSVKKPRAKKARMEETEHAPEAVAEPTKINLPRGRPKKAPAAAKPEESTANGDGADDVEQGTDAAPAVVAEDEPEAEAETDTAKPAKEQPAGKRGGRKKVAKGGA